MRKQDSTPNPKIGSPVSKKIVSIGVITASLFAVMSVLPMKHLGKISGAYGLATNKRNEIQYKGL